ncbi:MAG TPA: YadA C-terminal domain-containing protein [Rhizomicrobium sp.]
MTRGTRRADVQRGTYQMKRLIFVAMFALCSSSASAQNSLEDMQLPLGTGCPTNDANGFPTCLATPPPDAHMFAESSIGEFIIPASDVASAAAVDQISATLNQFGSTVNHLSSAMAQFDIELAAVQRQTKINERGVSMAFALSGVGDLSSDEHFAVAMNWGTFQGQNSLAAGLAVRASQNISFNAGISGDLSGGNVGGRAGVRFAW